MRTKSIFGVKSITNLIYGLLMIAPFVAILSRVIYVQANPNAKDSYSDKVLKSTTELTSTNQLITNQLLTIDFNETTTNGTTGRIAYNEISINPTDYGFPSQEFWAIEFARANNTYYLRLYYGEITAIQYNQVNNVWGNTLLSIGLKVGDYRFSSNNNALNEYGIITYALNYTTNSLDNAFEYSLQTFTQDNDIGLINFFGWFDGMFLNQSNTHTAIYLNFTNWYLNYALLTSSAYLLFLALIWFVNYIRRILDKSMNHDFGGF